MRIDIEAVQKRGIAAALNSADLLQTSKNWLTQLPQYDRPVGLSCRDSLFRRGEMGLRDANTHGVNIAMRFFGGDGNEHVSRKSRRHCNL